MDEVGIGRLFPVGVAACVADRSMYQSGLHAEEAEAVAGAVAKRCQDFAAGRAAARRALAMLGTAPVPILRTERRAPAWPRGFVGSITHCPGFCAAVVATSETVRSLGLDAETATPLDGEIVPLICSPAETAEFAALPAPARSNWPKLAFSAKEAFYKCVDPILGEFLDFLDARVRFPLTPAGDHGTFEVDLLRPDLAAAVTGRWAVDAERVYAGACWLRG